MYIFLFIKQIVKDLNIVLDISYQTINYNENLFLNILYKLINFIDMQDFDTSGYVNSDIDIDLNVVINDIRNYTNEFKLLNSPLKTNSLLSHSYNLI